MTALGDRGDRSDRSLFLYHQSERIRGEALTPTR